MSEKEFKKIVIRFYKKEGRHDLSWRKTTNPYNIVVSEIMLQQTQVSRVLVKYKEFLKKFPTVQVLAKASQAEVLKQWSGLGYNRRAKYLHQMAQAVVGVCGGIFPKTKVGLMALPGIGSYTAGAVMAFAYNKPSAMIETNIRTVYLHHFFPKKENISDSQLLPIITKTLDTKNPRQWYWSLMDYGSYLKKQGSIIHRKSKQYTKQSTFKGSRRALRGYIIRSLQESTTLSKLKKNQPESKYSIEAVLEDLIKEKLVLKKKSYYQLL